MTSAIRDQIDERTAALFRALSHPVRIAVLVAIAGHERAVGDLSRDLGIDASIVSQQLAVLRRAGLVRARREASVRVYQLSVPDVAALLDCSKAILAGTLGRTERLLVSLRETPVGT